MILQVLQSLQSEKQLAFVPRTTTTRKLPAQIKSEFKYCKEEDIQKQAKTSKQSLKNKVLTMVGDRRSPVAFRDSTEMNPMIGLASNKKTKQRQTNTKDSRLKGDESLKPLST